MSKVILAFGLLLSGIVVSYAQNTTTHSRTTASGETASSASKAGNKVDIRSGTRLAGELQNTIDVSRASVGDEVMLKTTEAIKSEGRTVVRKGSRLFGRVTDVSQKTEANGESRISVLFERLETGLLEVPISARIVSLEKGRASVRNDDHDIFDGDVSSNADVSTRTRSTTSNGQGHGSLLGGVVTGVNTTAGDVLGSTTTAVGSTVNGGANGLGRSLGRIQISESSNASAEGGSVLSLRGENLRVEKGTRFNLVFTQSARTDASRNE
jgi:hypothetical protein